MVFKVVAWSLHIQKQCVCTSDVWQIHFGSFALCGQKRTCCNQLDSISQWCFWTDFCQKFQCVFCHLNVLFFASCLNDLFDLILWVVLCLNNQETIQKIQWHTMGSEIKQIFTLCSLFLECLWYLCLWPIWRLERLHFPKLCSGKRNIPYRAYGLNR